MKKSELEQIVFKNIFLVSNRVQAKGDQISNELTLKQWVLLLLLLKNKMKEPTINDLAEAMKVTRQSVKKMVTILEKKEYLLVEKSSRDSRALCLSPTKKAYDFFKENKDLGKEILNSMFKGIEVKELTLFLDILQRMLLNLE